MVLIVVAVGLDWAAVQPAVRNVDLSYLFVVIQTFVALFLKSCIGFHFEFTYIYMQPTPAPSVSF
jgi:hypothetical protein